MVMTHNILQRHALFLRGDDGTLDEELILALCIGGQVLLHGLQHHWTAQTRSASATTLPRHRPQRTCNLNRLTGLHPPRVRPYTVKLENGHNLSARSICQFASEGAYLGRGRLDLERNRLRIVVGDLQSTLDGLSERSCEGSAGAEGQNVSSRREVNAASSAFVRGACGGGWYARTVEPQDAAGVERDRHLMFWRKGRAGRWERSGGEIGKSGQSAWVSDDGSTSP